MRDQSATWRESGQNLENFVERRTFSGAQWAQFWHFQPYLLPQEQFVLAQLPRKSVIATSSAMAMAFVFAP
jgi:hypothetical protein